MGMNRAQMISILNAASDDSLTKAMSAIGVQGGQGDGGMDDAYNLGDEEADGLQSWNSRDVKVEPSPRPPIVDQSKFTVQAMPKQGMRPDYGAGKGDLDQLSEMQYMPQEGMGEQ